MFQVPIGIWWFCWYEKASLIVKGHSGQQLGGDVSRRREWGYKSENE